jgi:cullin-associated NEDD8-dissociated protein 1
MDDDDDTSWKVRRAAIRVIHAVIKTRPDLQGQIIEKHGALIIDRYKERIDDVKCDVLTTSKSLFEHSLESVFSTYDVALSHKPSLVA